jgi:hypothetical protein
MFGLIGKFVLGLAFSYIAALLAPKQEGPKPATLEDFDIPKAEEGAEYGKIFGTPIVRDPQVADYGDLRTKAIKAKGGKK